MNIYDGKCFYLMCTSVPNDLASITIYARLSSQGQSGENSPWLAHLDPHTDLTLGGNYEQSVKTRIPILCTQMRNKLELGMSFLENGNWGLRSVNVTLHTYIIIIYQNDEENCMPNKIISWKSYAHFINPYWTGRTYMSLPGKGQEWHICPTIVTIL